MNVFERAREAFLVFRGRDHPDYSSGNQWGKGSQVNQFMPGYGTGSGYTYAGPSSSDRPDRVRMRAGNEKTIINAVYNRISLDVAAVEFHHAKIDENDNFTEIIKGSIEDALTVEANIDQASMSYMNDLVTSMLDEGVVAEVPVECDRDPEDEHITDEMPLKLRTGKITQWRPQEVRVNVYNELTGQKEAVDLPKKWVSIIENPFYSVMNQKNSIFDRLRRKLAILDMVNEKQGSDKLNMIMQLPYIVRTDTQRKTANARLSELEAQLGKSNLGIGYVDGTEKIIQLNRPIETNLQSQIEWLTELFYSQLCIIKEILNGTANQETMTNYMNRCVGTICTAIAQERRRKFLTKKQRDNNESIVFTQDPFKLIPVTSIADIADKLTRNAILSPNEVRGIIGYKPSSDETANQLVNRNMPIKQTPGGAEAGGDEVDNGANKDSPAPNMNVPYSEIAHSADGSQHLNRNQRRKLARQKAREATE